MSKKIDRFVLAFNKAFPWSRILALGFGAFMLIGFDVNDAWMAVLSHVSAYGYDDRFFVGAGIGFIIASLYSLFCGVALFLWYLFVPRKKVSE